MAREAHYSKLVLVVEDAWPQIAPHGKREQLASES
jgi:hypothetical protein